MSAKKSEVSARERLLAAASELFYAEGVHTVGIDRVIERAGVAKASLYSTFGSKEELVRAYLQSRAEKRRERMLGYIARFDTPREQILAVFELLGEIAAEPTFRGCAFVNASAEGPRDDENKVTRTCTDHRSWQRELFARLACELGARDPERLALQLVVLYDGAIMGAFMDFAPQRAAEARAMAALVLDAAVA